MIEPKRTVRAKLVAGAYRCQAEYPDMPIMPPVLNRRGADMTDEHVAELPAAKRQWATVMAEYNARAAAYRAANAANAEQFRRDLLDEYGIPADDPFGNELYKHAADRSADGGSHGDLHDVMDHFQALLPLWELYRNKK